MHEYFYWTSQQYLFLFTFFISLKLSALKFTLSGLLSLWGIQHFLFPFILLSIWLLFFYLHLFYDKQLDFIFIESSLGKQSSMPVLFETCGLTCTIGVFHLSYFYLSFPVSAVLVSFLVTVTECLIEQCEAGFILLQVAVR